MSSGRTAPSEFSRASTLDKARHEPVPIDESLHDEEGDPIDTLAEDSGFGSGLDVSGGVGGRAT